MDNSTLSHSVSVEWCSGFSSLFLNILHRQTSCWWIKNNFEYSNFLSNHKVYANEKLTQLTDNKLMSVLPTLSIISTYYLSFGPLVNCLFKDCESYSTENNMASAYTFITDISPIKKRSCRMAHWNHAIQNIKAWLGCLQYSFQMLYHSFSLVKPISCSSLIPFRLSIWSIFNEGEKGDKKKQCEQAKAVRSNVT